MDVTKNKSIIGGGVKKTISTSTVSPKTVVSSSASSAVLSSFGSKITTSALQKRFSAMREAFEETAKMKYGRFIIVGTGKSGKTYSCIHTLPTPIMLMMFDPNSEVLIPADMVEKGLIVPISYYGDDPEHPSSYERWDRDLLTFKRDGTFSYFASVVVDSLSTMQTAQLRQIAYADQKIKREKGKQRTTLMPVLQDYNVLKLSTLTSMTALCSLPCHVVLNAHIMEERVFDGMNDTVGTIKKSLNATPALQANIPPLFSEVYLAQKTKAGKYVWLTDTSVKYKDIPLGTRIFEDGVLETETPQDYRALLKRANFKHEDLTPLTQLTE